uniref:Uncharacterized protein n=1 Tax=Arundo donax TaxID=35708 RepID=A0A0A9EEM6_ARUDO
MSPLIHLTQWRPGVGCDTNTSYDSHLCFFCHSSPHTMGQYISSWLLTRRVSMPPGGRSYWGPN